MLRMTETEISPNTLPAVDLVYPLAMGAYDAAVRRYDAMDAKLNTLATFAVSVSLAVPVLARAANVSFHSSWFAAAAGAFVAGISLVTFARLNGQLMVFDPKTNYDSYLDLSEWEYKRYQIYWSGENFQHNKGLVNRNGTLAAVGAALFALEVLLIMAWVSSSVAP